MAPLKVYGHPASGNSNRAELILRLASVDFEMVSVNLNVGEQKGPEHRARSPWAKIPAIVLPDGTTLCESRAIVRYITAKYLPSLLPPKGDMEGLARYEEAASAEQAYFDRPAAMLAFEKYVKAFMGRPADDQIVEESRAAVRSHFEVLDEILARHKYVAGDELSFVDVNYLPPMQRLLLSGEWGLVEGRPHVEAWWKRCLEDEKIKKYLDSIPTLEAMKELVQRTKAQGATSKE